MYQTGLGVDQDYQRAFYWNSLANTIIKNKYAMFNIGIYYVLNQNDIKAEEWLLKAARHNLPEAYHRLGEMYWGKDKAKAYEHHLKAANLGYKPSQLWIGYMYKNGEYLKKNETKAAYWFRKADSLDGRPVFVIPAPLWPR